MQYVILAFEQGIPYLHYRMKAGNLLLFRNVNYMQSTKDIMMASNIPEETVSSEGESR